MANTNGVATWGIVPTYYSDQPIATMSFFNRTNLVISANNQLRYQVQWFYSGINEGVEVGNEGNVVNVIFKVETSVDGTYWETIGNIKKSRDIANRKYDDGTQPNGHRFTIDVSQLVSDQLSYSLCPINKGTWQSPFYGGMNGGLSLQDNVIGGNAAMGNPVSEYNVSKNGTFRRLKVTANFEILDADKNIITADNVLDPSPTIIVINSVNQFEKDAVYYAGQFLHNYDGVSQDSPRRFNTRCPNWYWDYPPNNVAYNKSVRMDEEAEFLQWYVQKVGNEDIVQDKYYRYSELYGTAYDYDGTTTNFVLADFNSLLEKHQTTPVIEFEKDQKRMLIQNVSPAFINANAKVPQDGTGLPYTTSISPLTANTNRYSLYFRGRYLNASAVWVTKVHSSTNWYQIDREDENIPYQYVRFHWLNSMGGTDSYTAKRDVVEGLNVSRDVVERKSSDRTWYQADKGAINSLGVDVPDDNYISDTMRGGDIYKGGREVLGVNAERVQSVYTEPLNKSVAKWLEEMILSPNVWIEMDTDATSRGNVVNPYLRPSTKEYIPVVITNSDIETVNQSEGLVKFNIEYTLSHKVQTQRN